MKYNFGALPLAEFASELDSRETVLIDIRTTQELDMYGVISDVQLHIIFGDPDFEQQILALDKDRKYLVYCWHGQRSAVVRDFMQANGFLWVKDLRGGIDARSKTKK